MTFMLTQRETIKESTNEGKAISIGELRLYPGQISIHVEDVVR